MPIESIKARLSALPPEQAREDLRVLIQAQFDTLVAVIAQITAKLDADATVTDTNYASLSAAVIAARMAA